MIYLYYVIGVISLITLMMIPRYTYIKFSQVIRIMEDDYPQLWESYGRPSRFGTTRHNTSLLKMCAMVTVFIISPPSWVKESPEAKKIIRQLQWIHLAVIMTIIIFVVWGMILSNHMTK